MPRSLLHTFCAFCLVALALHAEPITVVSGIFTVDATPPTIPEAMAPLDGADVTAPFLRLEAHADDLLSGVAGYDFDLDTVSLQERDSAYAVYRGLADGTYTWHVRARDAAGNYSDWATFTCNFVDGDDFDNDGIADTWELACFGRLDYSDGTADSDSDGVSDLLEAEAETHGFEFYVTLAAGWNMVALPCDTTIDSAAALVAEADGPLWLWDAATLRYKNTIQPLAREGMWIFTSDPVTDIPVSGIPPADNLLQLERGWNLTGSGLAAGIDDTDGIQEILSWSDGGYELLGAEDFEFTLLQGYWMYVTAARDRALVQPQ